MKGSGGPMLTFLSLKTWIGWFIMGASVTVFAYSTFRTESKAETRDVAVEKRLDKIELKVNDIYNLMLQRGY